MTTPLHYGVDVSKDTLHVAWATPADPTRWLAEQVDNDVASIEAWVKTLPESAHIVLEYTGSYSARLCWVLEAAQRPFSLITPSQSKGFALSQKSRAKTDVGDARLLARLGQQQQPAPTRLPEEDSHQLRQRHGHLSSLKVSAQALENRLHALSFDPKACPKVQASVQTLLESHQAQIALFEQDLDTFSDEQLQAIARQMQTVKGIGPVSAKALTALTDGLRHIESAKALACLVGVAPDRHESGSSVYRPGRMLKTGKGYLRGMLYMAARSARQHNRACQDLYERLRRRGKCHKVAMIAVVNKLLRQVFAVVKKGVPFDNHYGQTKLSLA